MFAVFVYVKDDLFSFVKMSKSKNCTEVRNLQIKKAKVVIRRFILAEGLKLIPYLLAVVLAIFAYRWVMTKRDPPPVLKLFADQEKTYDLLLQHVVCSSTYLNDVVIYPGCKPSMCGRYIIDGAISNDEVDALLNMVKNAFSYGGGSGGASILDVYTGAMSKGVHFINVYKMAYLDDLFKPNQMDVYRKICLRLNDIVTQKFGLPSKSIHLTSPTFFSRFNTSSALTVHDVYWMPHVDKITYPSFHYTTLLYLNDFGKDFTGGQFNYLEIDNTTSVVEPRKGRLMMFTSGEENAHYVSKVTSGERYAVTIAFTCDESKGIQDPFNNPYVAKYKAASS